MSIPGYLRAQAARFAQDPKGTNLAWFQNAKVGLFLHFGLYSLLGQADYMDILREIGMEHPAEYAAKGREWIQYGYRVPVHNYARLADRFRPTGFCAKEIVAFAKQCKMDYINLTTRHHEGFCLWDTAYTPLQSMRCAGRDFVAELYEACEQAGMALFLYYSHGRDWRHPHAPNNDAWGGCARPEYQPPEPAYAYGAQHDISRYTDFVCNQLLELLDRFPHIAGIWLDGIAVPQNGPWETMHIPELYAAIRAKSPHALISYKQGITGTEDFFAPEHGLPKLHSSANHRGLIRENSLIEVCTTIGTSWGYLHNDTRKTQEQVLDILSQAEQNDFRLLINTGLRHDGSLNEADTDILMRAFCAWHNTH